MTTNIRLSAMTMCAANWLVIRLLTLLAVLALSLATSGPEGFIYVNPIQVRIEPFIIRVGPNPIGSMESSLSLSQAETILGIVEDLVTDHARLHYDEIYDTDFNYVILSLVELLDASSTIGISRTSNNNNDDNPRSNEGKEEEYATDLEFSGGVGYFEGQSQVVPSKSEMQLLVELALNAEDLQEAISQEFPFIKYAAYKRGPYEQKDVEGSATESGSNDSSSSANAEEGSTHDQLLNDQLFAQERDDDTENRDSREHFIIVVASACATGVVVFALMGVLALFWRNERPTTAQNYNNKRFVASSGTTGTAIGRYSCGNTMNPLAAADAAFEDMEGLEGDSTKRRKSSPKQHQSLHLRDSLRESHGQQPDAQSESGSSLVGRLLSSASSAAANVLPSSITSGNSASQEETRKPAQDGTADPAGEDHDTSSSTASFHSARDDDDGDDLTYPSDFEGNAIIKPNLVPVTDTNLDRFNDDMLRIPIAPSRTASARCDEMPIYLPQTEASFCTPQKLSGTVDTRSRPKPPQEGFLSKYFHPLGTVSLPYFNSTCSGENNSIDGSKDGIVKKKGEVSPRTATTAGDVDVDARWSDVSSDLGDRTDDDFEMDKAWDPDDTSVNSRENGDGFSPMAPTELRHSDEILLLKSTGQRHYNLGKLILSSVSPNDKSKRRTLPINDTTVI